MELSGGQMFVLLLFPAIGLLFADIGVLMRGVNSGKKKKDEQ